MQICLIRFFSRSLFEQNHQRNKFAHCLIYRQNSFVKIEKKEEKKRETQWKKNAKHRQRKRENKKFTAYVGINFCPLAVGVVLETLLEDTRCAELAVFINVCFVRALAGRFPCEA